MQILVTGASGFIGSKLVPQLCQLGHTVKTFGRSKSKPAALHNLPIEHFRGDIADPAAIEKAISGCDIVFHMAGLVSYRKKDRQKQWDINVLGTRNVMQAALNSGVKRVIHTSSIAAMGIPAPGTIGDESIEYNLDGLGLNYCDTKHEGELEVLKAFRQGLDVVMLCPGIIFGEGDTHPHHHTIFASMLKGRMMGWPSGGVTFSDINDVVDAHIKAMTLGRAGERYVVGSANLSYREAALILSSVVGTRPPQMRISGKLCLAAGIICEFIFPLFGKRPPLTRQVAWLSQYNIFFQSDKAIKELDYKQTSFEKTIKRCAPYYLSIQKTNPFADQRLVDQSVLDQRLSDHDTDPLMNAPISHKGS